MASFMDLFIWLFLIALNYLTAGGGVVEVEAPPAVYYLLIHLYLQFYIAILILSSTCGCGCTSLMYLCYRLYYHHRNFQSNFKIH